MNGVKRVNGRATATPVIYVVDPSGKVKWAYVSDRAADRPSPVALAKVACAVAAGKDAPAAYPNMV